MYFYIFDKDISSYYIRGISLFVILLINAFAEIFYPKKRERINFRIKSNSLDLYELRLESNLSLQSYPKYKHIWYIFIKYFVRMNILEIKYSFIIFWVSTNNYKMIDFILTNGNYKIRTLAVQLLGLVNSQESIDLLKKALHDKVIMVVAHTINSLRTIGTTDEIENEIAKILNYWLNEEQKLMDGLKKEFNANIDGPYFNRSQMKRYEEFKKLVNKPKGYMAIG